MSASYNAATGRLLASDDSIIGFPNVFDTNDGLLFVDPDDVFTGSVVIPARTSSSQGVDGVQNVIDVQEDYLIGIPTSPGSRYVRGMIRTTASAAGEMMDAVWRQASGTHLDAMDGVSITMVPQSDLSGFQRLATMRGLTFFVNELGHLVLRERSVSRARDPGNPGTTFNRALAQSTVSYRLLVGSFFGADFTTRPGVQYRGASGGLSVGASTTFTGVNFGYAFPSRRLVAIINTWTVGGTSRTLTSCTIAGVTATILGGVGGTVGNDTGIYMAVADVPAGVSGNVVVGLSGNASGVAVSIYALSNAAGPPTISTAQVINNSNISRSVTVGANQIGLAAVGYTAAGTSGNEGVSSWANAQEIVPASPNRTTSAIITAGTGAATVTQAWSFAQDQSMIVAVWS